MAGTAQCRESRGDADGSVVEGLSAYPLPPAHTLNQPIERGAQPLVESLMLKVGRGEGGVGG